MPARAFNWDTATARGRDYVTLRSFCTFYNFAYAEPGGNTVFQSHSANHALVLKMGSPDTFLDGVHYVMSFPVEQGAGDWLVSRMDVIKLFEPVLRPQEIAGRHPIRGVVIDAGHGGTDNGATSRLGAEKNYTIDTAFRLQGILNDAGIKTVLTRRNDVFVDLYERAHIASMYPDYAFVSIHFNSASEEARGLETYCLAPRGAASTSSSYLTRADIQTLPGNDDDAVNILLASAVHSEIIRLNPGDTSMDRGVKRARFVVIKANQLPAILVEGGFVSNRMESARVNSPGYRQALAECIARGLIKFSNIMGNRHISLNPFSSAPAPPPLALAPPSMPAPMHQTASSSSQHVSATGAKAASHHGRKTTSPATAAASSTSTTTSVAHAGHKSKKKGKLTASATSTPAGAMSASGQTTTSSATTSTPGASSQAGSNADAAETGGTISRAASTSSEAGSAPLGLAEPAPPKLTAEAEKAPPEPDEPPTVNNAESASGRRSASPSTNSAAAGVQP